MLAVSPKVLQCIADLHCPSKLPPTTYCGREPGIHSRHMRLEETAKSKWIGKERTRACKKGGQEKTAPSSPRSAGWSPHGAQGLLPTWSPSQRYQLGEGEPKLRFQECCGPEYHSYLSVWMGSVLTPLDSCKPWCQGRVPANTGWFAFFWSSAC